jgi:hypothetical protein
MRSFLSPAHRRPLGRANPLGAGIVVTTVDRAKAQSSTGEEVPYPPDAQHGQQSAESDAGRNRPLAQACARNLLTSSPVEVPGSEPGRIEQMAQHMNGHRDEPKDKTGLVDEKKFLPEPMRGEQQSDAACEKRERQQHDDRAKHTQQRRRWALSPVLRRTGVVADEPVAGAAHLQQDGWHQ